MLDPRLRFTLSEPPHNPGVCVIATVFMVVSLEQPAPAARTGIFFLFMCTTERASNAYLYIFSFGLSLIYKPPG